MTGQLAGADYTIGTEAIIGTRSDSTIQLTPPTISSRHARIFFDDKSASYILEDFDSRNGTRVDGMIVRGTFILEDLHVITLADEFDFIFQRQATSGTDSRIPQSPPTEDPIGRKRMKEPEKTGPSLPPPDERAQSGKPGGSVPAATQFDDGSIMPVPPAVGSGGPPPTEEERTIVGINLENHLPSHGAIQSPDSPTVFGLPEMFEEPAISDRIRQEHVLRVTIGAATQDYSIHDGENIVGREEGCAIPLIDTSVSRRHAAITLRGERVSVRDLGSKNHTFVGNDMVTQETELRPGSILIFGLIKCEYLIRDIPAEAGNQSR